MAHVQGPSCPCLAVEPSVSLQTKTARCYKLYYCVADKTNNLVDGITFGHMLHFFKYFFVLFLFPHSSHTFDLQLPLKSIFLNTFMISGLKGPNWHCVPSSQARTSLPPSFHDTRLSLGSGPPKDLLCPVLPVTAGTQQLQPKETQPSRRPCVYKSS